MDDNLYDEDYYVTKYKNLYKEFIYDESDNIITQNIYIDAFKRVIKYVLKYNYNESGTLTSINVINKTNNFKYDKIFKYSGDNLIQIKLKKVK